MELRQRALESALGSADAMYLHATVPFGLGFDIGGCPDVLTHPDALPNHLFERLPHHSLARAQEPSSAFGIILKSKS